METESDTNDSEEQYVEIPTEEYYGYESFSLAQWKEPEVKLFAYRKKRSTKKTQEVNEEGDNETTSGKAQGSKDEWEQEADEDWEQEATSGEEIHDAYRVFSQRDPNGAERKQPCSEKEINSEGEKVKVRTRPTITLKKRPSYQHP